MFVNQQLPSDLRATERKGGDRRPGDTRLPARVCGFRLLASASPPARRRHLGRNLPGAYRNLLCGVTAFRLNPASSSCPSSRPLRRSRMLARCAAPPPGSWGPWEDAAPSPDTAALGAGGPRVQRGWEARVMWKARPRSVPRRRAHPGDTGAQPRVALRKLSASPGVWCFLPAEGASVKGDLFLLS